jgi:flagellar hook-associated protein 1
MTDLFTLGSSGLRAYSRAMGTIGDNIANAQTPGYARRRTQIGETLPAATNALASRAEASSGFRIIATERMTNGWRITDSRDAAGDAAMTGAALNWVEAAENALGQNGNSIGAALGRFFNSVDSLTADPAALTLREQVVSATGNIATNIRQTADSLSGVAAGVASEAGAQVSQINTDLSALHRVNISLLRAADGTNNQATLLDERDRLLDSLSSKLPVSTQYGAHGEVQLRALSVGNPILLDGNGPIALSMAQAPDGRLSFTAGATALTMTSGSIAGLANASYHLADQRAALDGLATQIANDLNAAHAAGSDANGNPGGALFTLSPLGAVGFATVAITASDIAAVDSNGPSGNLLSMASLRGPTGVEAGWAQQVNGQSQFTSQLRGEDAAAAARRDAAFIARSEDSAVDLDHEAAELLRFQQAYQAAARVIQVARENMQTIFNAF